MINVGLFGGTFDPVHIGHLAIAEYLREQLKLDEIWFIPANIHPLKNNDLISSSKHRIKMLELAIADNPYFKINSIELLYEKPSYTVDTIKNLKNEYAEEVGLFYFFIGMDNVNDLQHWKNPDELFELCRVIAFGRPGFTNIANSIYSSKVKFVEVPLFEISSTEIRNRIVDDRSVKYLIPAEVLNYIKTNELYK